MRCADAIHDLTSERCGDGEEVAEIGEMVGGVDEAGDWLVGEEVELDDPIPVEDREGDGLRPADELLPAPRNMPSTRSRRMAPAARISVELPLRRPGSEPLERTRVSSRKVQPRIEPIPERFGDFSCRSNE